MTNQSDQLTLILENLASYWADPNPEVAELLADAIDEGIDVMNPILGASIMDIVSSAPEFQMPVFLCLASWGYIDGDEYDL